MAEIAHLNVPSDGLGLAYLRGWDHEVCVGLDKTGRLKAYAYDPRDPEGSANVELADVDVYTALGNGGCQDGCLDR